MVYYWLLRVCDLEFKSRKTRKCSKSNALSISEALALRITLYDEVLVWFDLAKDFRDILSTQKNMR